MGHIGDQFCLKMLTLHPLLYCGVNSVTYAVNILTMLFEFPEHPAGVDWLLQISYCNSATALLQHLHLFHR